METIRKKYPDVEATTGGGKTEPVALGYLRRLDHRVEHTEAILSIAVGLLGLAAMGTANNTIIIEMKGEEKGKPMKQNMFKVV